MRRDDWFLIWIGLEINIMSFLFLFYYQKRIVNIESCMKYFFVQSVGSALFIRSLYFIVGEEWDYIRRIILRYKLGAGPFFFWFPSVVKGLGWIGAFFLITIQKIIPLILLIIFVRWMLWIILILSLVVGLLGSFNQRDVKILFAYSSIHHLGWLLICELADVGVWFYYLLIYSMVLSIVVILYYYEINRFMEVMKWKNKWWFFLGVMRLAGVPPLLGFFLKWLAFYYILRMNYFIIIFMIILSVIIFYIYIRVIYDILVGGVFNTGWFYKYYKIKFFFSGDFFIFLGVVIMSLLGLMLVI